MNCNWISILLILNEVWAIKKCPTECDCTTDYKNRSQIYCTAGSTIQMSAVEEDVQVFVIKVSTYSALSELTSILQPFKKLESLTILDSNLSSLGKYTFWGLPTLKTLNLAHNNITQVSEDNFRGQDNLLELNVSKNKIFKLNTNVFHYLKSLRELNLAENSIGVLYDRPFFMLTNLQYLDLSENMLQDLPPEVFKDVQELKILKCRRCQLKNINPQLYNLLNHLRELDLGENQFKYLVRDEFIDLTKLEVLRLDGNQLSVIVDHIFYHQCKLKYLDISRNRLAKITNYAFMNLTTLKYLDLSYNKITSLESISVKPLVHLNIFNLSGNMQLDLEEIRPTLQALSELSSISLSDMGVLPVGLLMPLSQIVSLNLSGNQIDDSSLQILNPVVYNLKFLDLSRNQLSGIDYYIALKLLSIEDVRLENNPFVCDRCHMGPIIDQSNNLRWHQQAICFLPERLRGYFISEINPTELDDCIELTVDEDHDAASTSHNFLDQKGVGTLIVFGGIVFIIVAGITFTTVMCYLRTRGGSIKRRFSLVDQQYDTSTTAITAKSLNQSISLSGDDEEKNLKFSLQASISTIDEIFIPTPPPPPQHAPATKKTVQFKNE